jgi:hypothetical protein
VFHFVHELGPPEDQSLTAAANDMFGIAVVGKIFYGFRVSGHS